MIDAEVSGIFNVGTGHAVSFQAIGKAIAKKHNVNMPIVFLTAKTLKEDMIKGFSIGADDYITKPFDSDVLIYKIKAILNRNKSTNNQNIEESIVNVGDLEVEVIKKDIKNIHLGVYPPIGKVRLSAPLSSDNDKIRLFIMH